MGSRVLGIHTTYPCSSCSAHRTRGRHGSSRCSRCSTPPRSTLRSTRPQRRHRRGFHSAWVTPRSNASPTASAGSSTEIRCPTRRCNCEGRIRGGGSAPARRRVHHRRDAEEAWPHFRGWRVNYRASPTAGLAACWRPPHPGPAPEPGSGNRTSTPTTGTPIPPTSPKATNALSSRHRTRRFPQRETRDHEPAREIAFASLQASTMPRRWAPIPD